MPSRPLLSRVSSRLKPSESEIYITLRQIASLFVMGDIYYLLLLPANEVCEGYVFTGVCLSTEGGGLTPRGYGQQAGGTHPTGMNSCLHLNFHKPVSLTNG